MDDQPYRLLELNKDNFPFLGEEPILPWMLEMQPCQLASRARDEGYACQNMKRSDEAVTWMLYAIMEESEWRDLPVGAVRFWKSFYQGWRVWGINGRRK